MALVGGIEFVASLDTSAIDAAFKKLESKQAKPLEVPVSFDATKGLADLQRQLNNANLCIPLKFCEDAIDNEIAKLKKTLNLKIAQHAIKIGADTKTFTQSLSDITKQTYEVAVEAVGNTKAAAQSIERLTSKAYSVAVEIETEATAFQSELNALIRTPRQLVVALQQESTAFQNEVNKLLRSPRNLVVELQQESTAFSKQLSTLLSTPRNLVVEIQKESAEFQKQLQKLIATPRNLVVEIQKESAEFQKQLRELITAPRNLVVEIQKESAEFQKQLQNLITAPRNLVVEVQKESAEFQKQLRELITTPRNLVVEIQKESAEFQKQLQNLITAPRNLVVEIQKESAEFQKQLQGLIATPRNLVVEIQKESVEFQKQLQNLITAPRNLVVEVQKESVEFQKQLQNLITAPRNLVVEVQKESAEFQKQLQNLITAPRNLVVEIQKESAEFQKQLQGLIATPRNLVVEIQKDAKHFQAQLTTLLNTPRELVVEVTKEARAFNNQLSELLKQPRELVVALTKESSDFQAQLSELLNTPRNLVVELQQEATAFQGELRNLLSTPRSLVVEIEKEAGEFTAELNKLISMPRNLIVDIEKNASDFQVEINRLLNIPRSVVVDVVKEAGAFQQELHNLITTPRQVLVDVLKNSDIFQSELQAIISAPRQLFIDTVLQPNLNLISDAVREFASTPIDLIFKFKDGFSNFTKIVTDISYAGEVFKNMGLYLHHGITNFGNIFKTSVDTFAANQQKSGGFFSGILKTTLGIILATKLMGGTTKTVKISQDTPILISYPETATTSPQSARSNQSETAIAQELPKIVEQLNIVKKGGSFIFQMPDNMAADTKAQITEIIGDTAFSERGTQHKIIPHEVVQQLVEAELAKIIEGGFTASSRGLHAFGASPTGKPGIQSKSSYNDILQLVKEGRAIVIKSSSVTLDGLPPIVQEMIKASPWTSTTGGRSSEWSSPQQNAQETPKAAQLSASFSFIAEAFLTALAQVEEKIKALEESETTAEIGGNVEQMMAVATRGNDGISSQLTELLVTNYAVPIAKLIGVFTKSKFGEIPVGEFVAEATSVLRESVIPRQLTSNEPEGAQNPVTKYINKLLGKVNDAETSLLGFIGVFVKGLDALLNVIHKLFFKDFVIPIPKFDKELNFQGFDVHSKPRSPAKPKAFDVVSNFPLIEEFGDTIRQDIEVLLSNGDLSAKEAAAASVDLTKRILSLRSDLIAFSESAEGVRKLDVQKTLDNAAAYEDYVQKVLGTGETLSSDSIANIGAQFAFSAGRQTNELAETKEKEFKYKETGAASTVLETSDFANRLAKLEKQQLTKREKKSLTLNPLSLSTFNEEDQNFLGFAENLLLSSGAVIDPKTIAKAGLHQTEKKEKFLAELMQELQAAEYQGAIQLADVFTGTAKDIELLSFDLEDLEKGEQILTKILTKFAAKPQMLMRGGKHITAIDDNINAEYVLTPLTESRVAVKKKSSKTTKAKRFAKEEDDIFTPADDHFFVALDFILPPSHKAALYDLEDIDHTLSTDDFSVAPKPKLEDGLFQNYIAAYKESINEAIKKFLRSVLVFEPIALEDIINDPNIPEATKQRIETLNSQRNASHIASDSSTGTIAFGTALAVLGKLVEDLSKQKAFSGSSSLEDASKLAIKLQMLGTYLQNHQDYVAFKPPEALRSNMATAAAAKAAKTQQKRFAVTFDDLEENLPPAGVDLVYCTVGGYDVDIPNNATQQAVATDIFDFDSRKLFTYPVNSGSELLSKIVEQPQIAQALGIENDPDSGASIIPFTSIAGFARLSQDDDFEFHANNKMLSRMGAPFMSYVPFEAPEAALAATASLATAEQALSPQVLANVNALLDNIAKLSGDKALDILARSRDTSDTSVPPLELVVDDAYLQKKGALGFYESGRDGKTNRIIISSEIQNALESAPEDLVQHKPQLELIIHELRHAFQKQFGTITQQQLMENPQLLQQSVGQVLTSDRAEHQMKAYDRFFGAMPPDLQNTLLRMEKDAYTFQWTQADAVLQGAGQQEPNMNFEGISSSKVKSPNEQLAEDVEKLKEIWRPVFAALKQEIANFVALIKKSFARIFQDIPNIIKTSLFGGAPATEAMAAVADVPSQEVQSLIGETIEKAQNQMAIMGASGLLGDRQQLNGVVNLDNTRQLTLPEGFLPEAPTESLDLTETLTTQLGQLQTWLLTNVVKLFAFVRKLLQKQIADLLKLLLSNLKGNGVKSLSQATETVTSGISNAVENISEALPEASQTLKRAASSGIASFKELSLAEKLGTFVSDLQSAAVELAEAAAGIDIEIPDTFDFSEPGQQLETSLAATTSQTKNTFQKIWKKIQNAWIDADKKAITKQFPQLRAPAQKIGDFAKKLLAPIDKFTDYAFEAHAKNFGKGFVKNTAWLSRQLFSIPKGIVKSPGTAPKVLGNEAKVWARNIKTIAKAFAKGGQNVEAFNAKLLEVHERLRANNPEIANFVDTVLNAWRALNTVTIAMSAWRGLSSILPQGLDVAADFEAYTIQLKIILGSYDAAEDKLRSLAKVAKDTANDVKSLISNYAQLAASTRDTILEGSATDEIVEAIAMAGAVYELSGEQFDNTMLAITQMASKGVVSMEELRRQLGTHLPGAMQIAARSMQMTEKEFDRLVSSGSLMSADFLPQFAAQIKLELGGGVEDSVGGLINKRIQFNNATTEMYRAIGEASVPLESLRLDVLAGLINFITDKISRIGKMLAGGAIYLMVRLIISQLATIPTIVTAISMGLSVVLNMLRHYFMTVLFPMIKKFAIFYALVEVGSRLFSHFREMTRKAEADKWTDSLVEGIQKAQRETIKLGQEFKKVERQNEHFGASKGEHFAEEAARSTRYVSSRVRDVVDFSDNQRLKDAFQFAGDDAAARELFLGGFHPKQWLSQARRVYETRDFELADKLRDAFIADRRERQDVDAIVRGFAREGDVITQGRDDRKLSDEITMTQDGRVRQVLTQAQNLIDDKATQSTIAKLNEQLAQARNKLGSLPDISDKNEILRETAKLKLERGAAGGDEYEKTLMALNQYLKHIQQRLMPDSETAVQDPQSIAILRDKEAELKKIISDLTGVLNTMGGSMEFVELARNINKMASLIQTIDEAAELQNKRLRMEFQVDTFVGHSQDRKNFLQDMIKQTISNMDEAVFNVFKQVYQLSEKDLKNFTSVQLRNQYLQNHLAEIYGQQYLEFEEFTHPQNWQGLSTLITDAKMATLELEQAEQKLMDIQQALTDTRGLFYGSSIGQSGILDTVDPLLNMKYSDMSIAQLNQVLQETSDENINLKTALENLIKIREMELAVLDAQNARLDSIVAKEAQLMELKMSMIALRKQEVELANQLANAEASIQIIKGEFNEFSFETDVKRSQQDLKEAKQKSKITNEEVRAIQKAFDEGIITAEKYYEEINRLRGESAQNAIDVATNELAVRRANERKFLEEFRRSHEARIRIMAKTHAITIRQIRELQIARNINPEAAAYQEAVADKRNEVSLVNIENRIRQTRNAMIGGRVSKEEGTNQLEALEDEKNQALIATADSTLKVDMAQRAMLNEQRDMAVVAQQLEALTHTSRGLTANEVALSTAFGQYNIAGSPIEALKATLDWNVAYRAVLIDEIKEATLANQLTGKFSNELVALRDAWAEMAFPSLDPLERLTNEIAYVNAKIASQRAEAKGAILARQLQGGGQNSELLALWEARIAIDAPSLDPIERMADELAYITAQIAYELSELEADISRFEHNIEKVFSEQTIAISRTKLQRIVRGGDRSSIDRQANEQTLKAEKERLDASLALAEQHLKKYRNMKFASDREREQSVREAENKILQLTQERILKEIELADAKQDRIISGYDKQIAAVQRFNDLASQRMDSFRTQVENISKMTAEFSKLVDAQQNLLNAVQRFNVEKKQYGIDASNSRLGYLQQLAELHEKASGEEGLTEGERYKQRVLAEMAGVNPNGGFNPNGDFSGAIANQFNEGVRKEIELAKEKTAQLLKQEQIQQAQLELQIAANAIAARTAQIEARIAHIKAQQSASQASLNLKRAHATGDAEEIANAENEVKLTNEMVELSAEAVDIADKGADVESMTAEMQRDAASVDKQSERQRLNNENSNLLEDIKLRGADLAASDVVNPRQLRTGGAIPVLPVDNKVVEAIASRLAGKDGQLNDIQRLAKTIQELTTKGFLSEENITRILGDINNGGEFSRAQAASLTSSSRNTTPGNAIQPFNLSAAVAAFKAGDMDKVQKLLGSDDGFGDLEDDEQLEDPAERLIEHLMALQEAAETSIEQATNLQNAVENPTNLLTAIASVREAILTGALNNLDRSELSPKSKMEGLKDSVERAYRYQESALLEKTGGVDYNGVNARNESRYGDSKALERQLLVTLANNAGTQHINSGTVNLTVVSNNPSGDATRLYEDIAQSRLMR